MAYSDLDAIHVPSAGNRPPASWGVQVNANFDAVYDDVLAKLGAWSTYTPAWTQSASITKTVTRNEYLKLGRETAGVVNMTASSAGTATNAIKVTTPVTAKWASNQVVGAGWHYNGSNNVPLLVYLDSTTTFSFLTTITITGGSYGTSAFFYPTGAAANTSYTPTIASGHALEFFYRFEAAA